MIQISALLVTVAECRKYFAVVKMSAKHWESNIDPLTKTFKSSPMCIPGEDMQSR